MKRWVAFGPGFSGDYDTMAEARAVVESHHRGVVYERVYDDPTGAAPEPWPYAFTYDGYLPNGVHLRIRRWQGKGADICVETVVDGREVCIRTHADELILGMIRRTIDATPTIPKGTD